MTDIFNTFENKEKRRALRNAMTRHETMLWARIRRQQLGEARFRRQYSIGPYVVDFYCPALRLAIEIDGASHIVPDAGENDRDRQARIESLGIMFLRFTNEEVARNLEGVLARIRQVVAKRYPP